MPNIDRLESLADAPQIQKEFKVILKGLKDIKAHISEINSLEVFSSQSKSLKDITASIEKLKKVNAESIKINEKILDLGVKQEKLNRAVAQTKLSEAAAGKKLAEQQLTEIRLRKANQAEIEKENKAKYNPSNVPYEIKGNLGGDPTDGGQIKNLDDQRDALNEVQRAEAEAANEAAAMAAQNKETAKSFQDVANESTIYRNTLEAYTGTIGENEQLLAVYKQELSNVTAEIKELEKTTDNGVKNTDAYKKQIGELTTRQTQLKLASSDLQKTIKAQITVENSAAGSLDSLRAKLFLTTQAYEKLSDAEKKTTAGLELKNQVIAFTKEIGKQEAEIGRFQRNVGNYTNQAVKAVSTGYGVIRKIANILPGLGISGVFLFLANAAQAAFDTFKRGLNDTEKNQKRLNEVFKESLDGYVSQKIELENIVDRIKKENVTNQEKTEILKEVNEKYKSVGIELKNINELENFATQTAPALARAYELKAKAAAAFGLAVKAATQQLEFQRDLELGLSKSGINSVNKLIKKGLKQAIDETGKAKDDYLKIQEDALKELNELQKKFNFDLDFKSDKKGNKSGKNKFDEERKAAFDLFKYRVQLAIEEQKTIQQISQGGQRNAARIEQARLEKELALATAAFELKEKDITASKIKLINEKLSEDLKKIDRERITDILKYNVSAIEEVTNRATESAEELSKLNDELEKKRIDEQKKAAESRLEDLQRGLEREIRFIERSGARELDVLSKKYAAGKLSKEKYEEEKLKIENKAIIASLKAQIAYYEQLALISDLPAEKQQEAIQKLHDLTIQLQNAQIKEAETSADKQIDIEKKKNEALKALALELADFTTALFQGQLERRAQEVDKLLEQLDKQKEKEIEIANQSIANENERARVIAEIEARTQARRDQLEERQKQIELAKAKFERARAIGEIIANTAVAVAKALPNLVLAGIVAAIGAVQIATVLATPLPRYKYGTGKGGHKGGKAIVGDGGKAEAAITPDGQIYKTPSEPTVVDLPKGTIVEPDFSKFIAKFSDKTQGTKLIEKNDGSMYVVKEIKQLSKDLISTVENMPQPIFQGEGRWQRYMKRGSNFVKYLNDNL